jgi:hypothetical protein
VADQFMKLFLDHWEEITDGLDLDQEAALLRIALAIYRKQGPIVPTSQALGRIMGRHPNKARKLLEDLKAGGLVVETDGRITMVWVQEQLDLRDTRRTQARDAGHTGGTRSADVRRKLLTYKGQDQATAQADLKQNEPEVRGKSLEVESPLPPVPASPTVAPAVPLADIRQPIQAMVERLFAQFPAFAAAGANAGLLDTSPITRLVAGEECDLALDVEATISGILARGKAPRSWGYFATAIREARDQRRSAPPPATATMGKPEFGGFSRAKNFPDGRRIPDTDGVVRVWVQRFGGWDQLEPDHPDMRPFWMKAMEAYQRGETWPEHELGMPPGHPHCLVPADGLAWMARQAAKASGAESTARH